jgi:putative membrane protein
MVGFTPQEHARLEHAVAEAEQQTSAELVLSVAEAADDYEAFALLGAGVAGVLALTVLAIFWPDSHVRFAVMVASGAAVVVGLILQWQPLRVAVVPASIRAGTAARLARLQFADSVAGRTKAANGLLIFVSVAEHHIEILPDRGIAAKIPESTWQGIISHLPAEVQRAGLADSLVGVVKACTEALAQAFPYQAGDVNEIPNAVNTPKR